MIESPLYSVERECAQPVDLVWHAWIDAASLEAWYHPTDLAVLAGSVVSEAEVGGWWTVAVDVPQYDMVAYFFGRYTVVEDGARLEHTMHYTQSAEDFSLRDESSPSHRVVVEFEARDTGTWVRFTQFGELPEGQAEQTKAGMESYFDSLQDFLG
jgi:uncharacterized protein YndB with AHSA1/START domain